MPSLVRVLQQWQNIFQLFKVLLTRSSGFSLVQIGKKKKKEIAQKPTWKENSSLDSRRELLLVRGKKVKTQFTWGLSECLSSLEYCRDKWRYSLSEGFGKGLFPFLGQGHSQTGACRSWKVDGVAAGIGSWAPQPFWWAITTPTRTLVLLSGYWLVCLNVFISI